MKTCRVCLNVKPLSEFYFKDKSHTKKHTLCKSCSDSQTAKWRLKNKEQNALNSRNWAKVNPEKVKLSAKNTQLKFPENNRRRAKAWAKANPEMRSVIALRWVKLNPGKANAVTANRRSKKRNATPAWANEFFIGEAYDLAALRTKMTGFKWNVDHIVPLISKLVCGLHTHDNLQVIPAYINQSKGNHRWPNMP